MNMLMTSRNLAIHELLHLQYGYVQKHKRVLMTPEQLEEHADKLGVLIGDVADVQAMSVDVAKLAIVFTKKSDGIEHRYSLAAQHYATMAAQIATDHVINRVSK